MRSSRDSGQPGQDFDGAKESRDKRDRGRGALTVIGLGPGAAALLAPAALAALEEADVIAGYKGYIKLVDPELIVDKEVLSTGMTGEVERARAAIESARVGNRVCVVSSGDPGVYAMAGLVLEILEADGLVDEIPFEVVPGIPALCAAAALLGAPLMHDFASISLSDLLTPWEVIENRLECAAKGDFVIIIYNPRSKKRADHLGRALDIIGNHREGSTPVGVVGRAYRPDQSVKVISLNAVNVEEVDMQTILVVGNLSTRAIGDRMLTPRGYSGKYEL